MGNAYLHQGFFTQSCQGPAFTVQPFTADVDGDGRAEVLCNNKKADSTNITIRRWTGETLGPEEAWMGGFCSGTDANSRRRGRRGRRRTSTASAAPGRP